MNEEARQRANEANRRYVARQLAIDPDAYRAGRRAYQNEWNRLHQDRVREKNRQARLDRVRSSARSAAYESNKKARKSGLFGRLSVGDVLALWARQPNCVICGNGRGIDHMVAMANGGANTPQNLQTLCPRCNTIKEAARKHAAPTCRNGHERSAANTYIVPRTGSGTCRICRRQSIRDYDQRQRVHAMT